MLMLLQYTIGIILIFATIILGIKGLFFGMRDNFELGTHKKRALYRTVALFCGLASFEIYYPTIDALICLPILLVLIWLNYFVARTQLTYTKK